MMAAASSAVFGSHLSLLLWLLVAAALPVVAVDRSKFRSCKQGSFCRRYEKYTQHVLQTGSFVHELQSDSLSKEGSNAVLGRLTHVVRTEGVDTPDGGGGGRPAPRPLPLRVAFYREQVSGHCGIVRVTIDEESPERPRFRLREGDVIVKDLDPDEVTLLSPAADTPGQPTVIQSSSPGNCSLHLYHSPFEAWLWAGGRLLQRLNARHLLNFEQHRSKEAHAAAGGPIVDATDVDSSDLWDEAFGDFHDGKPRGPSAAAIDVTFERAPVLVGLAEHATRLHLAAPGFEEPYRLFNLDVFEYEVDVPMALYGNVPMVTAVHHLPEDAGGVSASGFFVANPSEGFVKVDGPADVAAAADSNDSSTNTWWLFESGVLDLFCFVGPSPEMVLRQYHSVTGWPRLPPMAALGKHQSRWNYVDVEDALTVHKGFDRHQIPFDFLWLDLEHTDGKRYFTWDPAHFADAGTMLDTFEQSGRKIVTIIDPHLKGDENYTIFTQMRDAGLLTRSLNGSDYEGFCWPGPSFYPDFCNPEARALWATFFQPEVYPHSRPELYTWNDMNEPSVFNGPEITMPRDNLHKCHSAGYDVEHRDVHNVYGFYNHMASVEGQLLRAPAVRPFVLTRAFFAGTHRLGPVWTGDNMVSWDHLARSVPMLVSLSMCGLSLAGADVPGFMGDPDRGLFLRWHQLGIWYPFYRAHAHLTSKRREPWLFGEETTALVRQTVLTRYQMLPMWYTLIADWMFTGLPVLRPIWYHDLADLGSYKFADLSFFVGEALLVRSVAKSDAKRLQTYLPKGDWFDFWSPHSGVVPGGAQNLKPHPEHVPVFVRSGHILCKKMRPRRSVAAMAEDPYTVEVYGSPARGRIYIDDGRSHHFQMGAFVLDEISFDGASVSSRPAKLPNSFRRPLPADRGPLASPSAAGLRVERLVLHGLTRRPVAARSLAGDLPLSVVKADVGDSWSATIKEPGVGFGTREGWALELLF
mmetsp:Transcript_165875/g.527382  ORF Transcript_165875/g.527382 Transcript_165875/m.527382 type:complete len:974 (+) Transcript_165875:62-2983(+)